MEDGIAKLARAICYGTYLLKDWQLSLSQSEVESLKSALDSLSWREGQVLRLRYGLHDGQLRTLREVGEMLVNTKTGKPGVTGERVRNMEERALRRLRHPSFGLKWKSWLQEK